MYNFCVCSIFKNEGHILEEWLLHYIYHGVEHFYLVNDNSNDDFKNIINKYANYVTLFHNDIQTKNVGRQILIYNKYFRPILNESKWFAILDLDEFLYSPNDIHLPNIIEKYNNYAQLRVNWLHFGSSEHVYQPQSVIEGFMKRAQIDSSKPYFSYKSIFKGNSLINFGVHSNVVNNSEIYLKYEENNIPDLIINHYCIQSQDFFLKIKATRGDCDNWFDHQNLKRDLDYFKGYDINNIYDDRLCNQNENIINNIKNNKINNDEVTMVITTCNRVELLEKTLDSFVKYNTYPIKETFIIDDSGIQGCNKKVFDKFNSVLNIKMIYNKENIGIFQSIDKVYSYVTTKYIFYCDENLEFLQARFIEKSLNILNDPINEKVYTVSLDPHHCTIGYQLLYDNNGYYKMKPDLPLDKDNTYTYSGFTFNAGLRKTKNCLLFHPYLIKCEKSIKNGKEYIDEYTLNKKYADAGFHSVILDDPNGHVNHTCCEKT